MTPPGASGLVAVTVANPGAAPAVKADAFTYVAIPRATDAPPGTAGRHAPESLRRTYSLRPQARNAAAESAVSSTP